MTGAWWGALALPLLGLGQLALLQANLRRFQQPAPEAGPTTLAKAALLIPARDEARNVAACLQGAFAQAGLLGVWLLDDGSSDGTAELALQAAEGQGHFHLLSGAPRPEGWAGKPWACAQLAEAAEAAGAEWLIFLDADVRMAPGALAPMLALAQQEGFQLFSAWPRQDMGGTGERLLLPLLAFVLLAHLPLALAERLRTPSLSAANGQLVLAQVQAYRAWGGHQAVAQAIAEDLALARSAKAQGFRVGCRDGGPGLRCRMYPGGWAEIAPGFTKNLFPAFGGQLGPFAVGFLAWGLLHAWPLPLALGFGLAIALGIAPHPAFEALFLACLAQLLVGLAGHALMAARLGQPGFGAIAHPFSAALLAGLMLASAKAWLGGQGVSWKGRRYGAKAP